ncbi:hypothetical protein NL676_032520 [Syzygium grande]|nr:hypothetical protein NL676_032520 [Syzygium grande]
MSTLPAAVATASLLNSVSGSHIFGVKVDDVDGVVTDFLDGAHKENQVHVPEANESHNHLTWKGWKGDMRPEGFETR